MSDKPNKRRLQAEATKQAIIDAMRRLIDEKGYEAVTVDDIAQACGIGRGTLYHYFPSKDAIFGYIERGRFDDLPDQVDQMGLPSAEERLQAYVGLWSEHVLADSTNLSAYWYRQALGHALPHHEGRAGTHFDDDIANIQALLDAAVEAGELATQTPTRQLAQEIVFAMNGAAYYRCICEGSFDLAEWFANFTSTAPAALLAPYRK